MVIVIKVLRTCVVFSTGCALGYSILKSFGLEDGIKKAGYIPAFFMSCG
jgi:hypothetical protein